MKITSRIVACLVLITASPAAEATTHRPPEWAQPVSLEGAPNLHRVSGRPLMRDFIGLNGHFHFKPELYSQVCRLVRNYHNIDWDVKRPGDPITLPRCVNQVDWDRHVYGKWAEHGFESDLCAQFGGFGEGNKDYLGLWEGQGAWIREYGRELAKLFGPSGDRPLVTSIEIGNEPGSDFDDSLYRELFAQMARGIREGDPRVRIVTATAHAGEADQYYKSLDETFSSDEIKDLFDVINLHVYATKPKQEGRSPWDRSYPEDPQLDYLENVDAAVAWRDRLAPGKEIWITEFGYDACTPEAMEHREGWAKKLDWQGVTDHQQAQYLVRSIFCFAERDIGRAYIYFYNDDDKASVHAASGLTRNFVPKPSFWAVKHLYETLGDYRFHRVVLQQEKDLYLYEFTHADDGGRVVWVAWSPTGSGRTKQTTLRDLPGRLVRAERMPTAEGPAETIDSSLNAARFLEIELAEDPVYLHFAVE